ncbi:Hypothetical_protein [Hexamita inflata]|uniref:Hypothetical_protein n=1 Tax=Hexamita inflata TaxID=28002 RepID=A0AA86NNT6_9EUKA|nr:Hypothetical protein HINF_LOCUS10644 [Hexamita inflata]
MNRTIFLSQRIYNMRVPLQHSFDQLSADIFAQLARPTSNLEQLISSSYSSPAHKSLCLQVLVSHFHRFSPTNVFLMMKRDILNLHELPSEHLAFVLQIIHRLCTEPVIAARIMKQTEQILLMEMDMCQKMLILTAFADYIFQETVNEFKFSSQLELIQEYAIDIARNYEMFEIPAAYFDLLVSLHYSNNFKVSIARQDILQKLSSSCQQMDEQQLEKMLDFLRILLDWNDHKFDSEPIQRICGRTLFTNCGHEVIEKTFQLLCGQVKEFNCLEYVPIAVQYLKSVKQELILVSHRFIYEVFLIDNEWLLEYLLQNEYFTIIFNYISLNYIQLCQHNSEFINQVLEIWTELAKTDDGLQQFHDIKDMVEDLFSGCRLIQWERFEFEILVD